jgi:ornithine carbamoyltransferase
MDLLTLNTWSADDILSTVEMGLVVKEHPERYSTLLEGQTLAMLFQKSSTRTRVSFEVGMHQLGGQAVFLDWATTNFGLADVRDEAKVLSRYANVIMARMLKHEDLQRLATGSEVPVINGCCDRYHPCQALGDLLSILEVRGALEGAHVVYIGIWNNVCNSLVAACTKAGVEITTVTPEVNGPSEDPKLIEAARATGLFNETLDLEAAIADADFVYTDTWIDMEFFNNPKFAEEKERRTAAFMPFQINTELLEKTRAKVMHCLPAHKGYEVTEEVMDSDRCIAVDQAENRMHIQKAVLMRMIGPEKGN